MAEPVFTVVLPTYNHGRVMQSAFESILWQTRQDFEVFIICDGATEEGISVARDQAKLDSRFCVFEHPKGMGHGELYRDEAIRKARGSIICYLGDDDLWLPNHLEVMADALEESDLAYSVLFRVIQDGYFKIGSVWPMARLDDVEYRKQCLVDRNNAWVAQLSATAHRRDSYLSLPEGWTPRPKDVISYANMWAKFAEKEEIVISAVSKVTSLVLPSNVRASKDVEQNKEHRLQEAANLMKLLRSSFLRASLDHACRLKKPIDPVEIELRSAAELLEQRIDGVLYSVDGHLIDVVRSYAAFLVTVAESRMVRFGIGLKDSGT